ncbi:Sel1 domain protein repeat-containing protein [Seminavis robusta]|uniref:Sel1 domain protein repeat-containing protein n=1 Tax=Seminavis robusta TaxID=568900 RepID=A0A9N8D5V5_9STRA|nr:Sel1 domain protein repeat-containing protein [Seminavis robusta]|eukprot:Sro13_g009850.1 Sel1 domain protein repeat-containing protein (161) ;mRNA; f:48268-48750
MPHLTNKQMKALTDELICPITLEFPWDPVMAEDGHVYDRDAIEQHFRDHRGDLKSPISNKKMGKNLLPATQHRNSIEALVDSGVVDPALPAKWNDMAKQKIEHEKLTKNLVKKAESGDSTAMYRLGLNYEHGRDGFKQDQKLAFQWYKRALPKMCLEQPH